MNMKKDEFRSLRQGGRTLEEYMDDLYALSRYAPNDIDTDAKRKEKFLNGLKGDLKILFSVAYAPNYQSLLDQAITLDNNIRKEENRKRKFSNGKTHIELFQSRPTPLKAMEMVITPTAISTMVELRETTPMVITREAMVTIMEAMDITTSGKRLIDVLSVEHIIQYAPLVFNSGAFTNMLH
jgi:hypothetical protein